MLTIASHSHDLEERLEQEQQHEKNNGAGEREETIGDQCRVLSLEAWATAEKERGMRSIHQDDARHHRRMKGGNKETKK